jgi:hypothetical protein
MEAAQIVGAHDPDKVHAPATPHQIRNRLVGVGRADRGFDIGDIDQRMVREFFRGGDPLGKRRQPERVLQRIARRDQPPYAIKTKPPERQQAARCAAWGGSNVPPNRPIRIPGA